MSAFRKQWNKYIVDDDECWIWIGANSPNSVGILYGILDDDITRVAHRASYVWDRELEYEDIKGYDIHHTCEVTLCVNPEHLQKVTRQEHKDLSPNDITTINKNKTYCIRGHEFTPENTWVYKGKHRHCRECGRQRVRFRRSLGLP